MKHTTERYTPACGCRSVGECQHGMFAWMTALNALVDDFAEQMKARLIVKFKEGKSGWDNDDWLAQDIIDQMIAQAEKGDPIDTANFAAFLWNKQQKD